MWSSLNKHPLLGWVVLTAIMWQTLPDRTMGPYQAWNPHAIMEFVLALATISWAGTWAVRWLGPKHGLVFTGVVGGLASSTATIQSLGALARDKPELASRAALGAVLSNIATLIQVAMLLQLLAPAVLRLLWLPLLTGLISLLVYAGVGWRQLPKHSEVHAQEDAFTPIRWTQLLSLTALVCAVALVAAMLNAHWGQQGLWASAFVSGLVDAHAIVPSVATLLAQDQLRAEQAVWPLLVSLCSNALAKLGLAFYAGGGLYARHVALGVTLFSGVVVMGVLLAI